MRFDSTTQTHFLFGYVRASLLSTRVYIEAAESGDQEESSILSRTAEYEGTPQDQVQCRIGKEKHNAFNACFDLVAFRRPERDTIYLAFRSVVQATSFKISRLISVTERLSIATVLLLLASALSARVLLLSVAECTLPSRFPSSSALMPLLSYRMLLPFMRRERGRYLVFASCASLRQKLITFRATTMYQYVSSGINELLNAFYLVYCL